MSEKTTIGGTVYESIGSSSSNLLLKCNGTARIQWGSKLIDLVKNGKIATDNSSQLTIVTDESEIKSDGFYLLNTQKSAQFYIRKNGQSYNLTGTDLYVSANSEQDFTATQKQTVLKNIGIYYNTLTELQNANIEQGIVYVLETNTLYTIKDSIINPIQNINSVVVENDEFYENNENIKSSTKIIISDYVIFDPEQLIINKSVYIKDSEKICSENASSDKGYKLYIQNGNSYLDIDYINVRYNNPAFLPGMIIMYSQPDNIPDGWAVCDGKEYLYNDTIITTPDLTEHFIYSTAIGKEGTINYTLIFIIKL